MSAICNESVVASYLKLCHPLGQNRVIEWLDQDEVEAEWGVQDILFNDRDDLICWSGRTDNAGNCISVAGLRLNINQHHVSLKLIPVPLPRRRSARLALHDHRQRGARR